MKKIGLSLFIFIFFCQPNVLYADLHNTIAPQQASETRLEINDKTMEGFSAISSIGSIGLLEYQSPGGLFIALDIKGYSKNYGAGGSPNLPVMTKLIEIPYGSNARVVVKSYDLETISLEEKISGLKIGPMQPSVSKNIPSERVEFYYDNTAYSIDAFNTASPVVFQKIGTTRGVSFGRLKIAPFRYNPVQNSLQILNNISFKVIYDNVDISAMQKIRQTNYSPAFNNPLASVEKLPEVTSVRKDALIGDDDGTLTYVIVAHGSFKGNSSLSEFITWKRQSGFNVIDVYTGDAAIGSTTESIRGYLETLYQSDSPSYALFIGDVDKIPAWGGRTGSHATDLYYFTYDDTSDYIPEVYYGRFPADDTNELDAIISKTLQYEKTQFSSGAAYLDDYMFIAGDDPTYAVSHGNAQVNYAVNEYFPTDYNYIYTAERSGLASAVKANFSAGMGFVSFTGHCLYSGWYNVSTQAFYFGRSDVLNLQNRDKYGFVIGNCCLSNKFDEEDCFGEMLIKQKNGGAIGYIGAANDTFWDEDFYWSVGEPTLPISDINTEKHTSGNTQAGSYDGLFYMGNNESESYTTAGQIVYRGNLSVTETASPDDQYYWEIYNLMGDPSLTPFLSESESKNAADETQNAERDKEGLCFIETAYDAF